MSDIDCVYLTLLCLSYELWGCGFETRSRNGCCPCHVMAEAAQLHLVTTVMKQGLFVLKRQTWNWWRINRRIAVLSGVDSCSLVDGVSNHLWNVVQLLPDCPAQHPRRQTDRQTSHVHRRETRNKEVLTTDKYYTSFVIHTLKHRGVRWASNATRRGKMKDSLGI